jgi:outer membrane protein assembly factor BamB
MKKNLYLWLVALLFGFATQAQRNADAVITTENSINDITQNEITGVVVIKEGGNISGIDPESKKIIWTLTKEDFGKTSAIDIMKDPDFGKLFKDKRDLNTVSQSPYVEAYINSKFLIINTDIGKVVYNSSSEGFFVTQSEFIPETNEYLLTLKEEGDMKIALIDMNNGELKWKTKVDEAKSLLSFSLKESSNTNIAKINGNTIYYLLFGNLYSLDKISGKLNWTGTEEYSRFFLTQNDKNIVVVNSKGLMAAKEYLNVLNTTTGKSIWDESIKTKRVVHLEDWSTKLLIAHTNGFNFFDLATGEKIWKKDARGGGLKRVIHIDNDFLYVAENEMMLINKDGEKLWKNFIEIADDKEDPIYYLGKTDDKVMYLTGTYGNMVDYKNGKKLWKRNIKFNEKRPVLPTYDQASNSYLVYNDEKLYKFNPSIDDKPEPFAEVNIKNEKELNSIEMFPWGVAISGPVEVMGISLDGKVKYHNVYKQPGETGRMIGKGLAIAGSIGFAASSVVNSFQGTEITMTYYDENGKELGTDVIQKEDKGKLQMAEAKAEVSAAFAKLAGKLKSRFNAMKQNSEFSYIFCKSETTEDKILVKVRKSDGVELDKIIFKNNRPQYEIDPATQNIFYIFDNTVQIFDKK